MLIIQPTINQIVECFDPNDDQLELTLPMIKQRSNEEREHDLAQEKVFDLTMQLKQVILLLPRNGVLEK